MGRVCQVDCELSDLSILVVDEDEKENQANESGHETEEAEEQSLRGSDAIRFGVRRHLATRHAHSVVVFAPIPEAEAEKELK